MVVLQSHYLDGLASVVVAPLLRAANAERLAYLSIDVTIDDEPFVVSLHEMLTVSVRSLRRKAGDVRQAQDDIQRGLQRLFTGF